jgi:hypothetical protein
MALGSTQPLECQGYLLEKQRRSYHLHVPIVYKFYEPQPPGALKT